MKPENMTILTVDDTPANIRLLMHYLEKQGYNVISAEDGFEGFKSAIQYKPDLILLDVMMPGTDGYEVCELLKAEEETRDIPVVFLTAKTDAEDKVRGFELGAVDYITKPFKLIEISTRVEKLLQMRYFEKLTRQYQNVLRGIHPVTALATFQSHAGAGSVPESIESKCQTMLESIALRIGTVLLEDVIETIQDQLQSDPYALIDIEYTRTGIGWKIQGNVGLWYHALVSVIQNAVDINGGAGHFKIRCEPRDADDEGSHVTLFITQNDEFDEPVELSLNENFIKINGKTEDGFGFSTARRIIEENNGTIDIEFEADTGFKITVQIPKPA